MREKRWVQKPAQTPNRVGSFKSVGGSVGAPLDDFGRRSGNPCDRRYPPSAPAASLGGVTAWFDSARLFLSWGTPGRGHGRTSEGR